MSGFQRFILLALIVSCIGTGCGSQKEGEPDLLSSFSINSDESGQVPIVWKKRKLISWKGGI